MPVLPRFFDIHAHINDARFNADREVVLARMEERGVGAIVVGTDSKSSQDAAMIASFANGSVFASIGIHPTDRRGEPFREPIFAELAKHPRVVAIGECGLDYARLTDIIDVSEEIARQKKLFEAHADFAITHNLPLMIHCRDSDKERADAHRDVLAILQQKKASAGERLRGNIHFFSQTIDIAREYFALGFAISFTGVVTFSHEYDEVIREAPIDRIMAETDCPYVAPAPHRGERNEPIFVEEVVKKIAEIRGEDFETVRVALVQNALRFFNLLV